MAVRSGGGPSSFQYIPSLSPSVLPIKRHLYFAADDNFKFCCIFRINKYCMIFRENRLLADDSHKILCLILSKIKKELQKLSSYVVVIGTLKVN